MAFLGKFRVVSDHQPPSVKAPTFKFAPRWLAENQRTALRAVAVGLLGSLTLNGYQFYLREQIPEKPPEVFAGVFDPDMTSLRVVSAKALTPTQLEATAEAEVRRLVYRLRRVDSREQVQEQIDLLYCSVTGDAATKANKNFLRGESFDMVRKGVKRIVSERGIHAGRRPGEKAVADGMWISATWVEKVDAGATQKAVSKSAEFRVQQFKDIAPEIRSCNALGVLITDYEILDE